MKPTHYFVVVNTEYGTPSAMAWSRGQAISNYVSMLYGINRLTTISDEWWKANAKAKGLRVIKCLVTPIDRVVSTENRWRRTPHKECCQHDVGNLIVKHCDNKAKVTVDGVRLCTLHAKGKV
jgi:hypothetical protein